MQYSRMFGGLMGRTLRSDNEDGAGMLEYALLIALIGVALIVAIGIITGALDSAFRSFGDAVSGGA